MGARNLWGMTYKAIELEHDAGLPMVKVLRKLANYIEENDITGSVVSVYTSSSIDDEDTLLTTLIYAQY